MSKQAGVPVNVAQIRCYHLNRDESDCVVDWCRLAACWWELVPDLVPSPDRLLAGMGCTLGTAEQNLAMSTCRMDLPLSSRSPSRMTFCCRGNLTHTRFMNCVLIC